MMVVKAECFDSRLAPPFAATADTQTQVVCSGVLLTITKPDGQISDVQALEALLPGLQQRPATDVAHD